MEHVVRRFRLLAVAALIALSLSAFAGTAAAATGPAQGTGLVGACNMLHDATMASIPMVRNNPAGDIFSGNGNAGMWNAVAVSGGGTCS